MLQSEASRAASAPTLLQNFKEKAHDFSRGWMSKHENEIEGPRSVPP